MNINQKSGAIICMLILCIISLRLESRDLNREINLSSGWRIEIGDNMDYARPDWDDSDWERIRVPDPWEEQGFPGYDGYAWYRIRLRLPNNLQYKTLYLKLGYIDDVDAVYINGKYLSGSGSFPPEYQSAYDHNRVYYLQPQKLMFGKENVIAIRVYDEQMQGGIVGGRVGIYSYPSIAIYMDLSGEWRFSPGDDAYWASPDYDDSKWDPMLVPGNWENQGYSYHDGYGWYRKILFMSDSLKPHRLILCLGLIDDADEVFFNGTRIGRTGAFPGEGQGVFYGNSWQEDRFYMIPPHLIQWNDSNTLAVRVYDYQGPGGIYDGPIGLTTKEIYEKHNRRPKSFENFIKHLLGE